MMNRVTVDAEARTILAEGGCLWQEVDEEAAKFGLAAVGGTVVSTKATPKCSSTLLIICYQRTTLV